MTASNYDIDRQRQVLACKEAVEGELENLTASPQEVMQSRDRRLKALLNHAMQHSSWHRARLQSIDIDTFNGDDLTAIPPMTKSDLMANWDQIVCNPGLNRSLAEQHLNKIIDQGQDYLLDEYHVVATGGTSGNPGLIVWDFDGLVKNISRSQAWAIWLAQNSPKPELNYPIKITIIGAVNPTHLGYTVQNCFSDPNSFMYMPVDSQLPIDEIVAQVSKIEPQILTGYASIIHEIAKRKLAGEHQIQPLEILVGGEPLLPEAEECILEAFGCNIRNTWATTEVGASATKIPDIDGMILSEDLTLVEPVDLNNNPVPLGQTAAKLLVTNLVNKVLPLIRYEVSDECVVLPPDPESPWYGRRISNIYGRVEDIFYYDGIMIHPSLFRSSLVQITAISEHQVSEYQVQQTERGIHVLLRTKKSSDDFSVLNDKLKKSLEKGGVKNPEVSIEIVDKVERHPVSGKLKRFIALTHKKGATCNAF